MNQELQKLFESDRPLMQKNEAFYIQAIHDEYLEFKAEFEAKDWVKMREELADILVFAYSLASLQGFDLDEEVRSKIAKNMARFPSKDFQDGDYQSKRSDAKKSWADTLGDEAFIPDLD